MIPSIREWKKLAQTLRDRNVLFVIDARIRFEVQPDEEATFFVGHRRDDALKRNGFTDDETVFAK